MDCPRAILKLEWPEAFVLFGLSALPLACAGPWLPIFLLQPMVAPTSVSRLCSWKVVFSSIFKLIIQGTLRWFLLEKQGSAGGGNNMF